MESRWLPEGGGDLLPDLSLQLLHGPLHLVLCNRNNSIMKLSTYARPVLRSRDILARAGLKVRLRLRLQLRWKRKNSERYSLPSFQLPALIKFKLKNKSLKIYDLFSEEGGALLKIC